MPYYNPDGSINAAPSQGTGVYNPDGTLAVKVTVPPPDLSGYALKTDIPSVPAASQATPPAAALNGSVGTTTDVYALADHTHEVKVQRTIVTTDASGNATWTFAKSFNNLPAVTALANTTGMPIAISITAKSKTSVSIQAKQSRALPAVLTLLTNLLSYNIFSDAASGVQIDVFAAEVTQ